ncbi:MAG: CoA pyrophosphatase [Propionibacteriaceae bacterium]|nr:CoA pyrophosphatase [Propionibacteriaceae bacterium]
MNETFGQLVEGLRGALPDSSGIRRPRGGRRAGVLMLFTDESDPQVTVIERATTLRRHAGQVAFPGGAMEPDDPSIIAAALREAKEEVGLDPAMVEVLGELPVAWVPASNYDVTPVLGVWDGATDLWPADPAEVGAVHSVRVSHLSDPAFRVRGRHPGGYIGPAFNVGELFIWGFTAHLLDEALDLAGWASPWDSSRVVAVPERFLRD